MAYNKKDEDENTVVKVDRTSVFQEGMPPPQEQEHRRHPSYASRPIVLTTNHQLVSSTHRPYRLGNAVSS